MSKKMYEPVAEINGYKSFGELLKSSDEDIFFYGDTEESAEEALKELISDGGQEQAASYNKYYFDNWFLVMNS